MEVEQAGGIVLIGDRLVVRRTASGDWVLPKGHVEPGESLEEAARREMREEVGLETAILNRAGEVTFGYGGEVRRVHFFIMRAVGQLPSWPVHLGRDTFLVDAREASRVLSFENLRQLWERVKDRVLEMAKAAPEDA